MAAGYLIAHSDMLRDVPFDPFLPYLFLGEEILLSARLWTSGYEIFSPTISLVGHRYERNQQPKFWEAIHMAFTNGVSILFIAVKSLCVAYVSLPLISLDVYHCFYANE